MQRAQSISGYKEAIQTRSRSVSVVMCDAQGPDETTDISSDTSRDRRYKALIWTCSFCTRSTQGKLFWVSELVVYFCYSDRMKAKLRY